MEDKTSTLTISILSKAAYSIGCLCLYAIGILIFGSAVYQIFLDLIKDNFSVFDLLDEVGLIIFSIAVIDVAKHLMIEEVIKERERSPKEERHVFSRFVIIIVTALSLEGLVLTIETAKTDLERIVYPIVLFIVVTFLIIGLGLYQRLSSQSDGE